MTHKSMETMQPCYGCGIPMPAAPDAKDWEICDDCEKQRCPGCGILDCDGKTCKQCKDELEREMMQAEIDEEWL